MQKNDLTTVTIEDYGYQGEGIARSGGLTVFIPFTVVGEKVRARILNVKKGMAFAKVEEILTPADERVRPACPVFSKCGGCQLQHLKYSNQLRIKTDTVARCFKKYARLDAAVLPTVRSEHIYGYRNKLQLPVGCQNGRNVVGFYAPNSHRIVPIDNCQLQPVWTKQVIARLLEFLEKNGLRGYDESDGSGDVRHLIVREISDRKLITVVVNGREFAYRRELVEAFGDLFERCGLYLNFNDRDTNVILGERFEHLDGLTMAEASSHSLKFRLHPASFLQVNDNVREKIYSKVASLVAKSGCDAVVDAYSGSGILTAILAKAGFPCCGIEIVPEANENAEYIRCANNLTEKMRNVNGDCAEELPRLVRRWQEEGKRIAVVLDPPRKGCDAAVLAAVRACAVSVVLYISCNPATLARDVGILCGTCTSAGAVKPAAEIPAELDYELTYVQPYDMFPMTKHVETVALLRRRAERANELV